MHRKSLIVLAVAVVVGLITGGIAGTGIMSVVLLGGGLVFLVMFMIEKDEENTNIARKMRAERLSHLILVKQEKIVIEREQREQEQRRHEEKARGYAEWLKDTPDKLSRGGFSSLTASDRDELFLIHQLLMNGGDLNAQQNRLMEIALADPATSKFLELRGSQGATPSPKNSINPQMAGAFSALGIAGAAGIVQRGQMRQELNEINENLEGMSDGGADPGGGFDPSAGGFF